MARPAPQPKASTTGSPSDGGQGQRQRNARVPSRSQRSAWLSVRNSSALARVAVEAQPLADAPVSWPRAAPAHRARTLSRPRRPVAGPGPRPCSSAPSSSAICRACASRRGPAVVEQLDGAQLVQRAQPPERQRRLLRRWPAPARRRACAAAQIAQPLAAPHDLQRVAAHFRLAVPSTGAARRRPAGGRPRSRRWPWPPRLAAPLPRRPGRCLARPRAGRWPRPGNPLPPPTGWRLPRRVPAAGRPVRGPCRWPGRRPAVRSGWPRWPWPHRLCPASASASTRSASAVSRLGVSRRAGRPPGARCPPRWPARPRASAAAPDAVSSDARPARGHPPARQDRPPVSPASPGRPGQRPLQGGQRGRGQLRPSGREHASESPPPVSARAGT